VKHPKNQHYVPRLYLRQFSADRGAKHPQIYSFDKTTGRVQRPSIRNVAAELYFYERGDHGTEKAFQEIEDLFAGPYRRLLEIERLQDLSADDIAATVIFVAAQLVRTREHRQMLKSTGVELAKALDAMGIDEPVLTDVTDEALRQRHLQGLPDLVGQASAIMLRMKWFLCVNRTEMPMWTSDNPVTLHNSRPAGLQGNRGLTCRGIQLYVPLSPTRSLGLCDPIEFGAEPEFMISTDINHAWFLNNLQVWQSTRFVFANTGDFTFARQRLSEYPIYANPERPRSQVL
jgi:hypothetical protein